MLVYICIHTYVCIHRYTCIFILYIYIYIYIYILYEGNGGRKRGRKTLTWERKINLLSLACTLTRGWTCNPSVCYVRESNQWPSALQDDAEPTESYQSGLNSFFTKCFVGSSLRDYSPLHGRDHHLLNASFVLDGIFLKFIWDKRHIIFKSVFLTLNAAIMKGGEENEEIILP